MELLFLGTGAAEGVPAMYCECETCKTVRARGEGEYHTRSQLLIDGELGIDFPPDAYYRSLKMDVQLSRLTHLLITHSHMDHFYAHDFILRGYKYTATPMKPLHIYGNEEVCAVYRECTRRELRQEVGEQIHMHLIRPFQPFSLGEHNEYVATALLAQHSKTERAYVYLLEKGEECYLHLTDTGRLPDETLSFLKTYLHKQGKTIGVVTFDCTFLYRTAGEVSRHMGLADNMAMKAILEADGLVNDRTKYVITHFSHNNSPLTETLNRAGEEYGVVAAYDGMKLVF